MHCLCGSSHWCLCIAAAAAVAVAAVAAEGAELCGECLHCSASFISLSLLTPFLTLCLFGWTLCLFDLIAVASFFGRPFLAARQTLRRPLALCMLDPSSIRTHHALFHRVMCLFVTLLFSYVWLVFPFSLFSPNAFLLRSDSLFAVELS